MASIDSQIIKDFCHNLGDEVKRVYPHIDLYFVVYEAGMRSDEITKILPALKEHPAFEQAASLIRFKSAALEHSSFLGIAEGYEKKHFGLKNTPKHLAFFTINLADHDTEEDLIFTIYKLISQLFDSLIHISDTENTQPEKKASALTNALVNTRLNLRADIFNVLHFVQDGEKDAVRQRGQIRALQVLNPVVGQRPDEFAFPIAIDVTKYAIEKCLSPQYESAPARKNQILESYNIAEKIIKSFDNDSLKIWAQFVGPCQTLAWNGYSPSQILGAATLLSPNPYIKATGHLLAEITHIFPCTESQLPQGYNPFLDDEINQIRHRRGVEETFEMTMIHSLEADSHVPFLHVANNQNEALLKGHISGWCANALQAAARAYMGARSLGVPPQQAARLEFQTYRRDDGWKPLLQLAHHVIELCRNGTEAKTLSAIAQWCGMNPDLRFISTSLSMTISDPHYSAKMKAAVEMPHVAPLAPATELIRSLSSRNQAPAYVPIPAMAFNIDGSENLAVNTHIETAQTEITMED
ncbi:MAG: hypothetical protein AAB276_04275 [Pseudomonadota bacterium]